MAEDFLLGERYLKTPELVRKFVACLPVMDIPARYVVMKPLHDVDLTRDNVRSITFLVNPDQLSALVVLANYEGEHNENVIIPFAAGCQSIGICTVRENQREHSRAVIGLVDLSARKNLRRQLGKDVRKVSAAILRSITQALIWARKSLLEYERYYKKYLQGFEQMELVATASQLGARESRRILGDYVLNLQDFKSRAVFPDEIGRYSYPVDIHAAKPDLASYRRYAEDFKTLRYGKGESYGIPYRCLVPRKLTNVLVAGRCVSTDRYMQSSIRVMPGCFITGQAIGVAAAICAQQGRDTRGVSLPALQRRLKDLGAYLPNC